MGANATKGQQRIILVSCFSEVRNAGAPATAYKPFGGTACCWPPLAFRVMLEKL